MSMTVLNIVKSFCYEVNEPAPTTLIGVSDPFVNQLTYLLYSVGRDLRQERYWIQLKKQYSFNTVIGTSDYNLPSDFYSGLYETGWNSSTRLKLLGPTSDEFRNWELFGTGNYGANTQYTVFGLPGTAQFKVYPTPGSVQTIVFDYISLNWIMTGVGTWQEIISNDADTVAFDDDLMILGLKWKWLQIKGIDYIALEADYRAKIDKAVNRFKAPFRGSLTRYFAENGFDWRYGPSTPGNWNI